MINILSKRLLRRTLNAQCTDVIRITIKKQNYNTKMSYYSEIIFKSIDSVLEHLNKDEFKNLPSVRELLNIYHKTKSDSNSTLEQKRYPLIVLEGLDGCGKSTATKGLSNELNAELLTTPPACVKSIRADFDSSEYKEVRTAFYCLGNYIAAIEIINVLPHKPVVLDRFWHSTAAYAIAQSIVDYPEKYSLPPKNHAIYNWPADLLKPDVVAYLCVNNEIRLQRLKNRLELTDQEHLLADQEQFRKNVTTVYYSITPKIVSINAQMSKRKTVDQILKCVKPLLQN